MPKKENPFYRTVSDIIIDTFGTGDDMPSQYHVDDGNLQSFANRVADYVRDNTGWRPIDTAPKDGSWFLGYWPEPECLEDKYEVTSWDDDRGYFIDPADSKEFYQPTHWMPLPPPPGGIDDVD